MAIRGCCRIKTRPHKHKLIFKIMTDISKNAELQQSCITDVIGSPIDLEPVLAQIEHINDLGKSSWYEVVYYYEKWRSYTGSETFEDGEQVVKWRYAKYCL